MFSISISLSNFVITNLCKPPAVNWPPSVHPIYQHPAIYLGDFISHHTQWGCVEDDTNGETLTDWAESNHLTLIHDSKQIGTFHSARWHRDYNPDLCIVSDGQPLPCSREVLPRFLHSQHHPVIIDVRKRIPLMSAVPEPRWNFLKAKWGNSKQENR